MVPGAETMLHEIRIGPKLLPACHMKLKAGWAQCLSASHLTKRGCTHADK